MRGRTRDYAMSRRDMRRDRARRSRNALGQYTSDRRSRDYRDRERDMRDYNRSGRDYYNQYDGRYENQYNMPDYYDYRAREYRDYPMDYAEMDEDYERDLEEWMNKLRKHDKYGMSKEQVMEKAKQFGAKMEEYSEDELYATYLMMISDYGHIVNDPMIFIKMAIAFLEDEDSELKGSEKLCMYMYSIVEDREI